MTAWSELYDRGEFRWLDPDERVTALVALLRERGARRILDLACGGGRHLVYFSHAGFEVYGLDVAGSALALAREWLAGEKLSADMALSEMGDIPFPAEFFDAVICIRAIQHQTFLGMQRTMGEIHRVMRTGGLFLATFPSRRDRRYGEGEAIEPNTFVATEGPDAGVPHHYSSLAEIEELCAGFAVQRVELEERVGDQGNRFSHWGVLAEREK